MWFDVGQPYLRRRAAAGTSREGAGGGGSSPTGMSRMSSRLTCWGGFPQCSVFANELRLMRPLRGEKKNVAETRPSFVMSQRVSNASPSWRIASPASEVLTNLEPSAPSESLFFMIKAVNRGLATLFSLRSADLVLLNQSGDAAAQRSLGENWRPLSAKTLFRDGTRWPIAGRFRIRVEHQQKRKKTNKQGFCILMSFAYINVYILFCTLEYFIVIKEVYFICEI